MAEKPRPNPGGSVGQGPGEGCREMLMEPSSAEEQPGQELLSPCQQRGLSPCRGALPCPPTPLPSLCQQQPRGWESWSTAVLPAALPGTSPRASRRVPAAGDRRDAPGGARCQRQGGDHTRHPTGCRGWQGQSAELQLPRCPGTRDGSSAIWDVSGHWLPQKRGCSLQDSLTASLCHSGFVLP